MLAYSIIRMKSSQISETYKNESSSIYKLEKVKPKDLKDLDFIWKYVEVIGKRLYLHK